MKHGTSVEEANTFQCSGSHFLQKKKKKSGIKEKMSRRSGNDLGTGCGNRALELQSKHLNCPAWKIQCKMKCFLSK